MQSTPHFCMTNIHVLLHFLWLQLSIIIMLISGNGLITTWKSPVTFTGSSLFQLAAT